MNMTRVQALTLLRLEDGASDAEVNQAFRKLALRFHPDKVGGDGKMFKELGCARDILTGKQVLRPGVPASDASRFVVYRVEGLTSWKARRVYIGLVDTAKKSLAARIKEHRSHGSSCAAWLRAVTHMTWRRVDSAATLLQGLQKEAVHTGWELRLQDMAGRSGGYSVVRGACVVIISEKHARSHSAWQRQLAAARELNMLPNNMDAAFRYLRMAKAKLPQDIVSHLEGRCHICSRQGHMAFACPMQTSNGDKAQETTARRASKQKPKRQQRATATMKAVNKKTRKQEKKKKKKKKKKSGAQRAKAADDKGDSEAVERIRFGKKGKKESWKVSNKNYREKPASKDSKKVLNKNHNKKEAVKAQKKLYDQSDAAKQKRKDRNKKKRLQHAALTWQ